MLDDIAGRYGQATANLVALLMEYRRRHSGSQVERIDVTGQGHKFSA
jgi:hypothetical protein